MASSKPSKSLSQTTQQSSLSSDQPIVPHVSCPSSPPTTHSSGVSSITSSASADAKVSSSRLSSHTSTSSTSSSSSNLFAFGCSHQWSRQSSLDEGVFHSTCNSPAKSIPSSPIGPKFKLIHEGDIQLCRLNHQRTVISKILSSKFLRRWESHHLYLTSVNITSKTPIGFLEVPVAYSQIEDVYIVSRWDSSQKFCIRIVIPDGSVLLQLPNKWLRDQWLHSINWKRSMLKFQLILINLSIRSDVITKELKNLIDMSLTTPLQDECIYQTPLEIISKLLNDRQININSREETPEMRAHNRELNEEIISILSPLLERTNPTQEICQFLSQHCRLNPRSLVVREYYSEITQRILKHNMDFSKYPKMRVLVQDYVLAINSQNDGTNLVKLFIKCVHGLSSTCPHPRVLINIINVCLAALSTLFEERRAERSSDIDTNKTNYHIIEEEWKSKINCFINILYFISFHEDWRPGLAQILQPIPFPDIALTIPVFTSSFKSVIKNICLDNRCEVHQLLLGVREEKESWLQTYCPGSIACDDEGDLWSFILKNLINCCCRRKGFLMTLNKSLGPIMLRALRDDDTCQQILCAMLELNVVDSIDMQQQIITTLQTTQTGRSYYSDLCQRQLHLKELQQKGGPKKLTLPSRSTDADVTKLLSCGSFGNLECLSLAFTQVTSACAEQLIKLPSLRYLNLWSTQFGDNGLQLISEHLQKLQVLNLCETPVTDKGLKYLTAMKNLRKLNLNSTRLSTQTFERLKQKLPALQEIDIRYTEAW
ncbi:C-Maf-inducing protein-like [Oppia nitens]|uniref:C-Maf-inducing protein-like n=1 Tax=Oppia nitens TaxID=1686743 RepID=UPI0023DB1EBA|nr:C-Maf-inducing protein-like [Oppia nitens]